MCEFSDRTEIQRMDDGETGNCFAEEVTVLHSPDAVVPRLYLGRPIPRNILAIWKQDLYVWPGEATPFSTVSTVTVTL